MITPLRLTGRVRWNLLLFGSILILLSVAYWPILQGYFVYNDDCLVWSMEGGCTTHPQFYVLFAIARPLCAFLECPLWLFVKTVRDLNIVRCLNVFMLSVSACLFCTWLQKHTIPRIQALLVTVAIFMLPAFQVGVLMIFCFTHLVALLASIGAGFTAYKGANGITGSWKSLINKYTALSMLLLFCAMALYPPNAMFYWVMLLIPFVQSYPWHPAKKWALGYLFGVPLATAGMYFLFAKMIYRAFLPFTDVGGHTILVTVNPIAKVSVLVTALVNALNLWNPLPSLKWILAVGILLLDGAILVMLDAVRKIPLHVPWLRRFAMIGSAIGAQGIMIACLLPLSILPSLVAHSNSLSVRMLTAISALVGMLLFFTIRKIGSILLQPSKGNRVITLILVVCTGMAMFMTQSNLRQYIALPASLELNYVKSALRGVDLTNIRTISVIRPPFINFLFCLDTNYACRWRIGYDEFGLLTSFAPGNIEGLVRFALRENGSGSSIPNIKIVVKDLGKKVVIDSSQLDMSASDFGIFPLNAHPDGKAVQSQGNIEIDMNNIFLQKLQPVIE
jgi:hypothetical protein